MLVNNTLTIEMWEELLEMALIDTNILLAEQSGEIDAETARELRERMTE